MLRRLLLLCLPLSFLLPTGPPAAAGARVVSVDYVIGMIEAGLDQTEIIDRIRDNDLTFRMSVQSLDRLRDAGAGDDLIEIVSERAAPAREDWERPRRLGEYGDLWSGSGESVDYGLWYGFYPGVYGYSLYDPFGFYDPFYLPYSYRAFYYPRFYAPRFYHRFHGSAGHPRGDRVAPRGSPHAGRPSGRGGTRSTPRGSH